MAAHRPPQTVEPVGLDLSASKAHEGLDRVATAVGKKQQHSHSIVSQRTHLGQLPFLRLLPGFFLVKTQVT